MKRFCLVSEKKWHVSLFEKLSSRKGEEWTLISKKENFTYEYFLKSKFHKVFIPHWSDLISDKIYGNFECIIFHMTDLPYGRGGSPLQNLIIRKHQHTVISAIAAIKEIDSGPIYLKAGLSLDGTAEEIFIRSSSVIEMMITNIIDNNLTPFPQKGKVTKFKRRKPFEGNIKDIQLIEDLYDFIRMMDCEGYPPAFIETDYFKLELTRALLKSKEIIIADVKITRK